VNLLASRASENGCLLIEHEYYRSLEGNHSKGFVTRIQNQRAHDPPNKKRAIKMMTR
jgi:hypothetical protein